MSEKECTNHDGEDRRNTVKPVVWAVIVAVGLLGMTVLVTWLVLRPSKPRFILQDVSVYNFTVDGAPPYAVSTMIQATISSQNPNDRIGIYYRRLDAFASYRGQQLTAATLLPEGYQGHGEIIVWSPVLFGAAVPVSSYLQVALAQDLAVGAVLVQLKVSGSVRWRVGSWVSNKYRIDVNCPALLRFNGSHSIQMQLVQRCHVEV